MKEFVHITTSKRYREARTSPVWQRSCYKSWKLIRIGEAHSWTTAVRWVVNMGIFRYLHEHERMNYNRAPARFSFPSSYSVSTTQQIAFDMPKTCPDSDEHVLRPMGCWVRRLFPLHSPRCTTRRRGCTVHIGFRGYLIGTQLAWRVHCWTCSLGRRPPQVCALALPSISRRRSQPRGLHGELRCPLLRLLRLFRFLRQLHLTTHSRRHYNAIREVD